MGVRIWVVGDCQGIDETKPLEDTGVTRGGEPYPAKSCINRFSQNLSRPHALPRNEESVLRWDPDVHDADSTVGDPGVHG